MIKESKLESQRKNILLVYQAPWDWDFLWNRAQPFAQELSQHCTVLYLDCGLKGFPGAGSWLGRIPYAGAFFRRIDFGKVTPIQPNLYRYIHYHVQLEPLGLMIRDRSRLGRKILVRQIEQLKRQHNCERLWLLTSRPALESLANLMSWDKVIADVEDPWLSLDFIPYQMEEKIRNLFERADVIFSNGQKIAESYGAYTNKPLTPLANGVAQSFLEKLRTAPSEPQWMKNLGAKKKIVYTGHINDRLDYPLILKLAQKFQELLFVFVGLENVPLEFKLVWAELKKLPNVSVVGQIPHQDIPGVLTHADLLWIPHHHSGASEMFPAKLLEYIAAGKWILSSEDYSGEIGAVPGVLTCRTFEDYGAGISNLLNGSALLPADALEERRRLVQQHSWAERAEVFFQTVEKQEAVLQR